MAQEPTETQAPPEAPKIKMAASPLPPEEIYVDGVAGLFARPEVVKLDCYRVVRIDADRAEVRTITHRLVLPIQSFRELATLAQKLTSGRRGAAPAAGAAGSGDGGAEEKKPLIPLVRYLYDHPRGACVLRYDAASGRSPFASSRQTLAQNVTLGPRRRATHGGAPRRRREPRDRARRG